VAADLNSELPWKEQVKQAAAQFVEWLSGLPGGAGRVALDWS
jgi:hypothetical protein